jgi:transcription initiation factor TFIID subunit 5
MSCYVITNAVLSVNCIDFSDDGQLVAAGTTESVIRVWSMDGKPLKSTLPKEQDRDAGFSSRRLAGHTGTVYAISFAPSAANDRASPFSPDTRCKWLLSASIDKSVGLWNLETWQLMVKYMGHNKPVWDVQWGPFGHYFLSGGHDRAARLWTTDHVTCHRIFAGHDSDVDCVAFHPNSAYVFTGSCDKTVRMWAVTTGNPVRMFVGHPGNITAIACSPSGKLLASADDAGVICLWDLGPGKLFKRMRGHGKGGIWSISWSVESTVLTSGGADGTVRMWDINGPAADPSQGKVVGEGGAGAKIDVAGTGAGAAGPAAGGTKKKGNVVITPDQISAFPTKKSPVYKVKFTRKNLIIAAGCYLPNNP